MVSLIGGVLGAGGGGGSYDILQYHTLLCLMTVRLVCVMCLMFTVNQLGDAKQICNMCDDKIK